MPEPTRRTICLCCFQPTMQLLYDKKSRPYLRCLCGVTIFAQQGDVSIVGYGIAARAVLNTLPSIRAAYQQAACSVMDGAFAPAEVAEKIGALAQEADKIPQAPEGVADASR